MKFLLGLIIGIGIAVGVVLYVQNKGTIGDFMSVQHSAHEDASAVNKLNSSSPMLLAPGMRKMQQASEVNVQVKDNLANHESEQIKSYDFYDVLEGKKSLNESVPAPTNANTTNKLEQPTKLYLQIGAYSNPDEANNMKARLLLMDIDAKIISATVDNKLFNKVIVGPFKNSEDARKAQTEIQTQGISAIITNI